MQTLCVPLDGSHGEEAQQPECRTQARTDKTEQLMSHTWSQPQGSKGTSDPLINHLEETECSI